MNQSSLDLKQQLDSAVAGAKTAADLDSLKVEYLG